MDQISVVCCMERFCSKEVGQQWLCMERFANFSDEVTGAGSVLGWKRNRLDEVVGLMEVGGLGGLRCAR